MRVGRACTQAVTQIHPDRHTEHVNRHMGTPCAASLPVVQSQPGAKAHASRNTHTHSFPTGDLSSLAFISWSAPKEKAERDEVNGAERCWERLCAINSAGDKARRAGGDARAGHRCQGSGSPRMRDGAEGASSGHDESWWLAPSSTELGIRVAWEGAPGTLSSWDGCFATLGNGKQRGIAAGIVLGTDGRSGSL